jgi:hypothetical protein
MDDLIIYEENIHKVESFKYLCSLVKRESPIEERIKK